MSSQISSLLKNCEPFVRGYALLHEKLASSVTSGWGRSPLGGGYELRSHRKTEVARAERCGRTVLLIGRAYDPADSVCDAALVANRILERLEVSFDAALRYVAYLGGRHVVFIYEQGRIRAIPDCHATYAIHASVGEHGALFCSHWTLGAEILGLQADSDVSEFMSSPEYVSPGGKYYPALWGPCIGLRNVFPNCVATFELASGTFAHERFYPFMVLETANPEDVYPHFLDAMKQAVKLCCGSGTALSLTAGGDSRAVLAAAMLSGGLPDDSFAFTYARFNDRSREAFDDVVGASKAAFVAGVRHLVLDLPPADFSCDFHQYYSKSFRIGARFPALTRLYFENLPHDTTILIATVAETGTVFYTKRDNSVPTPAILAEKFTPSAARLRPELLHAFAEYQGWTQFESHRLFNFDWHDLFYWEHRNAKWASVWYAELDLTGFAIAPYNNRRLIELMLSLPEQHRRSRYLQMRIIAEAGL